MKLIPTEPFGALSQNFYGSFFAINVYTSGTKQELLQTIEESFSLSMAPSTLSEVLPDVALRAPLHSAGLFHLLYRG